MFGAANAMRNFLHTTIQRSKAFADSRDSLTSTSFGRRSTILLCSRVNAVTLLPITVVFPLLAFPPGDGDFQMDIGWSVVAEFKMLPKTTEPARNERMDAFMKKLENIATNGVLSLVIALGIKLKIFEAVGELSSEGNPVTADLVADKCNLKPRYVLEWMSSMACADLLEVSESGDRFWVSEEKRAILCGQFPHPALQFNMFSQQFGNVFDLITNVFRKDGPLGTSYKQYDDFPTQMNELSKCMHGKHLIPDLIPLIGIDDRLRRGLQMLDVGCGSGFHVNALAKHFPLSSFSGVDVNEDAILDANQEKTGLHNTSFLWHDAAHLPADWEGKFDWVTIFDACHDQIRPDKSLGEIYRVLKPGGLFSMVEVKGTSNVYDDKIREGDGAGFQYGISMFHCLPIGNSTEDALGLGTKWGEKRARDLLGKAGFKHIDVVDTPFFPGNVLYLCRKEESS